MAWGQRNQGIDDILQRLHARDPRLQSLTLMRQRKLDGAKDVHRLCAALADNPHLTELSISAHALDAACVKHLADLLSSPASHLKTINIGNSTLGDEAMIELCRGLAASTSVTHLDAEQKGLTAAATTALGAALSTCQALTSVLLGGNALGDAGLQALCASPWAALRHLNLRDVGMGEAGLAALASCPGLANLRFLSCAHNPQLGEAAAQHVQQLIQCSPRLTHLDLSHTSLGDAGARAVAAALGGRPAGDASTLALTDLDLSHTGTSDVGGAALAASLGHPHCPLSTLSLEGNAGITDLTVAQLQAACVPQQGKGDAGSGRARLAALSLSQTSVSPKGLRALSAMPGLRQLALLGCRLGVEGAQTLAEMVSRDGSDLGFAELQDLVVSGCGFDKDAVHVLLGVLERGDMPALRSVEMGGNPGCQVEGVHERVEALRAARPELSVHWRAGDSAPA